MTGDKQTVHDALKAQGYEVLGARGGFFVRGEGFVSLAVARRRTGIEAPKRQRRERMAPSGSYAEFAAIVGRLNG